jgi:CRP-like cAMP-binding protein
MLAKLPSLSPLLAMLERRSPVDERDAKALLELPHSLHALAAGQYLFRDGAKPEQCHVLLDGYVFRHKVVGDGGRQIIGLHMRGDLLGFQGSLLGTMDNNVQALTAVRLAAIDAEAMAELAQRRPSLAKAIWVSAMADASLSREWLASIGRRDAHARLAHLLCELFVRQEAAGLAAGDSFELPMNQEQLGDTLGLTSVHINRTLRALEVEGLISRRRRSVRIEDWAALKRAGDFRPTYLHLQEEEPAAHATSSETSRPLFAGWRSGSGKKLAFG